MNSTADEFHVASTLAIGGGTTAGDGGRPFFAGFQDAALESDEIEVVTRSFGFVPVEAIGIAAGCKDPIDHRILGELAAHIADRFGGIIDFCGALGPGPLPHVGKFEASGRFGDAAFMRGWLTQADFCMVK